MLWIFFVGCRATWDLEVTHTHTHWAWWQLWIRHLFIQIEPYPPFPFPCFWDISKHRSSTVLCTFTHGINQGQSTLHTFQTPSTYFRGISAHYLIKFSHKSFSLIFFFFKLGNKEKHYDSGPTMCQADFCLQARGLAPSSCCIIWDLVYFRLNYRSKG